LVAQDEPLLPSLEHVFAEVRQAVKDSSEVTEIRTAGRAATCRWGEAVVGVTLVCRPIPSSLVDGPCENAWYWPDAAAAVRQHKAHLLINLVDESRDLITKALRLTWLTLGACRASNAVAVLWAPGGLIHQPQAFAEQALQSSRSSLPLYLWIDFRVLQHADGRTEVFTTGLSRFGKREIELAPIEAAPQQALEWAYNLAHYMIERETTIKDAETVGLPGGAEFTVQHTVSHFDNSTPVLALSRLVESG
jgi:hypothetical protein